MSMTSGSFNAAIATDNIKEVGSHAVVIPAATNAIQTVNPTPAHQAATIYNLSAEYVRVVWTFSAGVTNVGAAATRVSLIPPQATYSLDFSDHDGDTVASNVIPVDQVTFQAVTFPAATAEAGTLTAPASLTAAANLVVNFASA